MIELYTWPTPNGHKVHIMLEETGLSYNIHKVDISAEQQFKPDFLKINPNNKVPAIIDQDGPEGKPFPVFESGAILIYLAEKTGKFLPKDAVGRSITLQWLMFQMANIGPMMGQFYHFRSAAPERIPYAIDRYTKEVTRILNVLNKRLGEVEYLAGDYSIADMAAWPWVKYAPNFDFSWVDFPNVKKWHDRIAARPAVQKGMTILDQEKD